MKSESSARSSRFGVRTTLEQEMMLRRAAEVAQKSLTDFILDSACRAAENTLLDQRLFIVDDETYDNVAKFLERPAKDNPGLKLLFSKPAPWDE